MWCIANTKTALASAIRSSHGMYALSKLGKTFKHGRRQLLGAFRLLAPGLPNRLRNLTRRGLPKRNAQRDSISIPPISTAKSSSNSMQTGSGDQARAGWRNPSSRFCSLFITAMRESRLRMGRLLIKSVACHVRAEQSTARLRQSSPVIGIVALKGGRVFGLPIQRLCAATAAPLGSGLPLLS